MAARFDGSSDQLSISTTIGPATTGASFGGWVYVVGLRSDWTSTMGLVSSSGYLNVNITPDNEFLFDSSGGGVSTGYAVDEGVWYFIAGTITSGGTMTFYVATEAESTFTTFTGSGSVGAGQPWVIGNSAFGEWLDGRVAFARVWTGVLSAAELLAERSSTSAVRTADLWADWPLEGDTLDVSGNGRHLTAAGTVTWEASPTIGSPQTAATLGVDVAVTATAVKRGAVSAPLSLGLSSSGGGPKAAASSASLDLDVAVDAVAVMHAVTAATLGVALDLDAAAAKVAQTAAELGVSLTVDAAAGKVAAAAVSLGLDITTGATAAKTAATEAVLGVALDLAADSAKTAAVAAALGVDLAVVAAAVKNEPGHTTAALALALACIAAAVKRAAASATLGVDLGVSASAVKRAAATVDLDLALGVEAAASVPDVPHATATFGLALSLSASAVKAGQTVSTLALLVALTAAVPSGIIRVLSVGPLTITTQIGDLVIIGPQIGPLTARPHAVTLEIS